MNPRPARQRPGAAAAELPGLTRQPEAIATGQPDGAGPEAKPGRAPAKRGTPPPAKPEPERPPGPGDRVTIEIPLDNDEPKLPVSVRIRWSRRRGLNILHAMTGIPIQELVESALDREFAARGYVPPSYFPGSQPGR